MGEMEIVGIDEDPDEVLSERRRKVGIPRPLWDSK